MIRLLREWKQAGQLRPRRGYRWQDGPPRRRHPVWLWDAEAVGRLLAARRHGEKSPASTESKAAEASPTSGVGPGAAPGSRLNETQQAVVRWLREHGPDFGKNIARGLGFPFNSHFRGTLCRLVRDGILQKEADGYAI